MKKNRIVMLNIVSTLSLYLISFLTAPIFASLLGTESFGDLSVFNTWVSLCAIVMTLNTSATIANSRVEYPEEEQIRYQSSAVALSLIFFMICVGLVLLFLDPLSGIMDMDPVFLILIMITALGTFGVQFMNQKWTFEMKAGRNMAASVALAVLNLGVSLLIVLNVSEDQRLLGRASGVAACYGCFGIPFCAAILFRGRTVIHKQYWKFCLSLSIPVVFYGITDLLLGHSDLVMLRSLDGSDSAGIYGLSFQISNVMFTIFTALNTSWVAFFFNDMKAGRRDVVLRQSKNYLELYTILACGFILLAPEVFRALTPKAFHEGIGLIPWMVASFYLNFLCTFPYNCECYHRKMTVISVVTVISALLNVVLNYVLILRWGMYGAAVATFLARVFQFGAHFFYSRFLLCKKDYLFGIKIWGAYALGYGVVMILVILIPDCWLLRWSIGIVLGVFELSRIYKRRAIL